MRDGRPPRSRRRALVGAALLGLAPPLASQGALPFDSPVLAADDSTSDIELVRLPGDDWPDLVVCTTHFDKSIKILPGKGDGGFEHWKHVTYLQSDARLRAADFDGDGLVDVAAVQEEPAVVLLYLGQPDGTLTLHESIPIPSDPWPVWTADVDLDGDPDLLVLCRQPTAVVVLENVGGGDFASPSLVVPGIEATDLAVDDVDADGDTDLVLADASGASVVLLAGDGTGGFGPTTVVPLASAGPKLVRTGDFNGDGLPDLLRGGLSRLQVHLGLGGMAFGPALPVVEDDATPFAVADLDENGADDIICGYSRVKVHLSLGDGGFAPAVAYGALQYDKAVAVGDLNVDGDLDLVVATGFDDEAAFSILFGRGDGTLGPLYASAVFPGASYDVAAGDLDGDGLLDLVSFGSPGFSELVVLPGVGSGDFGAPTLVPTKPHPRRVVLADFDEDGRLDALVGHDIPVTLHLGTGQLEFGPPQVVWAPSHDVQARVAAADVDADGHLDAVLASGDTLQVLLGRGNGTFDTLPGQAVPPDPAAIALADVDADGTIDYVQAILSATGGVAICLGNGAGRFGPAVTLPIGQATRQLVAADVDQDGDVDLVACSGPAGLSGTMTVLLNDGRGGFAPVASIELYPPTVTGLATGDFDRDGRADVATSAWGSFGGMHTPGRVEIWRGSGDGQFTSRQVVHVRPQPRGLIAADLSGDGAVDLATSQGPSVLVNRLGPWQFLGDGLAGVIGLPKLTPSGPLAPGSTVSMTLTDAARDSAAWLVSGMEAAYTPFKGGVLVPAPDAVAGPFLTGHDGGLTLSASVPRDLPSGTVRWDQFWILDAQGPVGLSASNAVSGTSP